MTFFAKSKIVLKTKANAENITLSWRDNRKIVFAFFALLLLEIFYLSESQFPDLSIILDTTRRFIEKENVYFPESKTTAYNAPITYLILLPLLLFDFAIASKLFLFFNFVMLIVCCKLIFKIHLFRYPQKNKHNFFVVALVLILSFSGRSIISNGQIGILVLFCLLNFLILCQKEKKIYLLAAGVYLAVIMELKPYYVLPLCIYLLSCRKWKIVVVAISWAAMMQAIYFAINTSSTLPYYFKALIARGQETQNDPDQSSLPALLNRLIDFHGLPLIIIFVIVANSIVIFYLRKIKSDYFVGIINCLLIAPLISPYFHRQDSLFSAMILALILYSVIYDTYDATNGNLRFYFATSLILLMNWGNASFWPAILLDTFLWLLVLDLKLSLRWKVSILIVTVLVQGMQVYIFNVYGWIASYHLWTPLVFLFQLSVTITFNVFIKIIRNENSKSGQFFGN